MRVRVAKLGFLTSTLLVTGALATASPAGVKAQTGADLRTAAVHMPAALAKADRQPIRRAAVPLYSLVEAMPSPGVLVDRGGPAARSVATLLMPAHYGTIPVQTAFAIAPRPHPVAIARAPLPRPERPVAVAEAGADRQGQGSSLLHAQRSVAASPLLAYAPSEPSLEAPFDVLLGAPPADLSAAQAVDDGVWRPRARPDPEPLLSWLGGRSLGQFAPGQHDWVTNPLPASVHSAREQKCLADAIYFESRGESEEGQAAVAQVILNRVRAPAYPDTICGVVYQNKRWRNRCQFSFACDGKADRIRDMAAFAVAQRIAGGVTDGRIWLDEIGDSTHYYANYVRPRWARSMYKMDRIGAHLFYRTKQGGWS